MAFRDKIGGWAEPFLEEGERLEGAFPMQGGMHPLLIGLAGPFGAIVVLLFAYAFKYRVVLVTDRGLILLRSSPMRPTKPKHQLERLPRDTPLTIEKAGSMWTKMSLQGARYWVHRRYRGDFDTARQAAGGT